MREMPYFGGYQEFVLGSDRGGHSGASRTSDCDTCHNASAMALTSVTFRPEVVETDADARPAAMTCHQGRESKVSVDKQINETLR